MNIVEAAKAAEEITREAWKQEYSANGRESYLNVLTAGCLRYSCALDKWEKWTPTKEDLLADDWAPLWEI